MKHFERYVSVSYVSIPDNQGKPAVDFVHITVDPTTAVALEKALRAMRFDFNVNSRVGEFNLKLREVVGRLTS